MRLHDDLLPDGAPPVRGGRSAGPRGAGRVEAPGPPRWFDAAATTAVQQLARQVPVDLWLVTRPVGGARLVAAAAGPRSGGSGAGVSAGTSVRFRRGGQEHVAAARPSSRAPDAVVLLPPPSVEVPLTDEDGSTLGWLQGVGAVPPAGTAGGPPGDARGWAEMTARLLAAVLAAERCVHAGAREASRAHDLAEHDELTGLHNRRGWVAGLRRCPALRAGDGPVAVLALDLDDLKAVNDADGHAAGDALLARCGAVVRATSRVDDLVARTGGDEFAVLARAAAVTPAGDLERRVRAALAAAGVAASLGMALRRPGEDLTGTWRRADAAMYADKRARRGAGP